MNLYGYYKCRADNQDKIRGLYDGIKGGLERKLIEGVIGV